MGFLFLIFVFGLCFLLATFGRCDSPRAPSLRSRNVARGSQSLPAATPDPSIIARRGLANTLQITAPVCFGETVVLHSVDSCRCGMPIPDRQRHAKMYIIFLLLSGTCSATASVLLRVAGKSADDFSHLSALFNQAMLLRVGALGAYGLGFIFYAIALKKIELSVAYPLMVGVTVFEIFVFGMLSNEALTLRTLTGAGFLLVGVVLLFSSVTPQA
jgi:small multidrug resistance pump